MGTDIRAELAGIRRQLLELKTKQECLEDALLSPTDRRALRAARRDAKEGKTHSLADVKKRLGMR